MEKLTETPEKYSKKRKILSFKEFTPAKKSKFTFLYFNIFRKRKNEGKKEKKLMFPPLTYSFLKNQSRII
jgi:hypothetical protein